MSRPEGSPRKSWGWGRGLLLASGVLFLVAAIVVIQAETFFGFKPPAGVAEAVARSQKIPIEERDGLRWIGANAAFERRGILACSLAGSAAERGAAFARFFPEQLAIVETSLVETVQRFIPSHALRWVLARIVTIRNQDLDQYVPLAMQEELAAVALASQDLYPAYGGHFTRLMNYLAAHDISHALMDTPLMACTAFGSRAEFAQTRTPLLARNFDFEAGAPFDRHKVVMKETLPNGRSFLSVAWPGMVGVVSGMNDAGLAVVLLAGHSQGRRGIGSPISVVARQILEEADTLEEAVRIAVDAKVFVSESLLIGSGPENRFAVVEKTPRTAAVRRMEEQPVLVVANHFLSPELTNDPANQAYMRDGNSVARFQRMEELLAQAQGRLDPALAVAFLRDRRAPGGAELGLGNRLAINPLIASHSVVFDLNRKIAWVSASPHQLGAFVPFSLERFEAPAPVGEIPEDSLLARGTYAKYLDYEKSFLEAEQAFRDEQYQAALDRLQGIRGLNPLDYHLPALAGRCLERLQRQPEALAAYQAALRLRPAFLPEREELEKAIRRLQK